MPKQNWLRFVLLFGFCLIIMTFVLLAVLLITLRYEGKVSDKTLIVRGDNVPIQQTAIAYARIPKAPVPFLRDIQPVLGSHIARSGEIRITLFPELLIPDTADAKNKVIQDLTIKLNGEPVGNEYLGIRDTWNIGIADGVVFSELEFLVKYDLSETTEYLAVQIEIEWLDKSGMRQKQLHAWAYQVANKAS